VRFSDGRFPQALKIDCMAAGDSPVITGINFSNSAGVWKRCIGSLFSSVSRRTTAGCGTSWSWSIGNGACKC
jgi:hypothetical protein